MEGVPKRLEEFYGSIPDALKVQGEKGGKAFRNHTTKWGLRYEEKYIEVLAISY